MLSLSGRCVTYKLFYLSLSRSKVCIHVLQFLSNCYASGGHHQNACRKIPNSMTMKHKKCNRLKAYREVAYIWWYSGHRPIVHKQHVQWMTYSWVSFDNLCGVAVLHCNISNSQQCIQHQLLSHGAEKNFLVHITALRSYAFEWFELFLYWILYHLLSVPSFFALEVSSAESVVCFLLDPYL